MLTLILLRHAKAEGHSGEDFARQLTERGKADAAGVGRHMGGLRIRPDLALVSAAERTRQTYDIYAAAGLPAAEVRYEKALYNASESALRDILRYVDPRIGTLMVVGHNPGIMDAAVHLARHGDAVEITRLRGRFPPGSLALVAFDSDDWRDARASGGRLDLLLLPEDIASPS